MYIQPNTNIRILKNVPLDTSYDHTIWFESAGDQSTYFISKQKYNLTNYTYQRVNSGVMRVEIEADNLYDCNYLMFQNTSFGNKWFYAFITEVNYINNEVSEIKYDMDDIQTWLFDFTLEDCFVEREHTETDVIGEHIEAEPVNVGEYVFNDYQTLVSGGMNDLCTVVAICDVGDTSQATSVDGKTYDGIYGACQLRCFDNDTDIDNFLAQYIQRPDTIVAMYMLPKYYLPTYPTSGYIPTASSGRKENITLSQIDRYTDISGYRPRNAKLYTYPYNFIQVDNGNGQALQLRYEYFENLTPVIELDCTLSMPATAVVRPNSYKGVAGYNETTQTYTSLNTELLQMETFPLCSWSFDAYQSWISQNQFPLVMRGVQSAFNIGGNLFNQGSANTIIGNATNAMIEAYKASIASDTCKGNMQSANVNVSCGKQQFYYGRMSVDANHVEMIDDFFARFGYAVKRVKKPNTHTREAWNYVKTIGCCITGSIPCDSAKHICAIHDKGITYWANASEVGQYRLSDGTLRYNFPLNPLGE